MRRHLELCLDCRACETACPSGVQYGKLIEPFRVAMEAGRRRDRRSRTTGSTSAILFGLFPYPERMRKALWPGADRAAAAARSSCSIATGLWQSACRRDWDGWSTMLPPLEKSAAARCPTFLPAKGRRRARVALFTGCVADVMFRQTNWATARVLQENGCDVRRSATQAAAGRFTSTPGSSDRRATLADANVAAFEADDVDAIIVNVAGCGAMLKDYGHHWHDAQQPVREAFRRTR